MSRQTVTSIDLIAIAMPMGTMSKRLDHRQSARHRIEVILDQADQAYRAALSVVAGSGRAEDVRQACLSLALLRAFQTSLGQGGTDVTSFAADILGKFHV
jgi:separase